MIDLTKEGDTQVFGLIHGAVKVSDPIRTQVSQLLQHPTSFVAESSFFGIDNPFRCKLDKLAGSVLHTLHFRVHNTRVITFPIDVVYLGDAARVGQCWNDDMLKIDREHLRKASPPCSLQRVGSMISGSPGIGSRICSSS